MNGWVKTGLAMTILGLAGCASGGPQTMAPAPAKPIDATKFYTGRWYEIGRTPIFLTDGCMAGTTDFFDRPDGQLMERDACHKGSPTGPQKVFKGPVTVLDAAKTKISVAYHLYGFIPVTKTYWMLDHGDDYNWFIVSDPALQHVDILSRDPRPSAADVRDLTARVRALGYDPGKLEFPERFPPGQG